MLTESVDLLLDITAGETSVGNSKRAIELEFLNDVAIPWRQNELRRLLQLHDHW